MIPGEPAKSHPEVGRELLRGELVAKTIYVLIGDHRPRQGITARYMAGDERMTVFYAGVIDMTLLLVATGDGELYDDLKRRIRVYEYKGDA